MLSTRSRNTSTPTSPLPSIDQPIIEGKPLELEAATVCRIEEIGAGEPKQLESEIKKNEIKKESVKPIKKTTTNISKPTKAKPQTKLAENLKKKTDDAKSGKNGAVKNRDAKGSLSKSSSLPKVNEFDLNAAKLKSDSESHIARKDETHKSTEIKNIVTEVVQNEGSSSTESFQDPAILEIRTKETMPAAKSDTPETSVVKAIDSPSEDQKTYDMIRKTGVQSAEKSTSTDDDFPRLPPVKKPIAAKVNQECQTEETDKKTSPTNKPKVEPLKITSTVRSLVVKPAYSTALARSQSAKVVSAAKPKVESKPASVVKTTVKPAKQSSVSRNVTGAVSRVGLARSKTVGDMKSTNTTTFKPINRAPHTKPLNKISVEKKEDCASSVETLVNHGRSLTNSSNSIASSSETLNNDDVKNNSLHSDGWLTVKNRSRFRSGYQKGRKSDTVLSWATRFHQVSATASLPALALLPEASEGNKSIDKTIKDSFNSLKQTANKSEDAAKSNNKNNNRTFLKRSHTTLSKMTVTKTNKTIQEKHKTNEIIKSTADENKYKKTSDAESETDDNIQDDLATDEEDRKKALQLCEEEERLEQEIAELQGMEIDVDTETDGTETDGELQCETDDQSGMVLAENEEQMSLEARYEPMLAGNYIICS